MKWLSTIKQADEGKLVLERMELDETGFPQPTGELEELEADSLVLALGQETDLSLLDGVPGLEVEDGVVAGRAEHDDRPPRDLRRRRHGARRAHGDGRASATARRPRATSTPGCAARRTEPAAEARRSPTFDTLNTWYYADAPRTRAAAARARAPAVDVRRGRRRPRRVERALRGAPLPVVRQLLLVRQLLRRLPRQRGASSSATRASRTRSTSTSARAAASASPSARPARSRWCPRRSSARKESEARTRSSAPPGPPERPAPRRAVGVGSGLAWIGPRRTPQYASSL